jgi:hypothetical protein
VLDQSPTQQGFSATAQTSAPLARVSSATSADSSKRLLRWVIGILALFLIGGIGMAALAGMFFGFWFSSARAGDDSPSPSFTAAAPATPTDAGASAGSNSASDPPAAGEPARTPNKGQSPATASTPVAKKDEQKLHRADYKEPWYRSKITQCWKGNEGSKPDAGSHAVTITVTLGQVGRADKVSLSTRVHPRFAACATRVSAEHAWGPGPVETKSFSFNF